MSRTVESEMTKALCEFGAEGQDCEDCLMPMPPGDAVYFFSDGGMEPRDGTYVCKACATKQIRSSFGGDVG